MVVRRFDIYLVSPDPTNEEANIQAPLYLIVSPDEMNRHIETVIVAPLTKRGRTYPTRIPFHFRDQEHFVVLDQLQTVEKRQLVRFCGRLSEEVEREVLNALAELFAASTTDRRREYEGQAQEAGLPFVDLMIFRPDSAALARVPRVIAAQYHTIPVKYQEEILFVAVASPNDIAALDAVRQVSGCTVRPVLSLPEDIEYAISRCYDIDISGGVE